MTDLDPKEVAGATGNEAGADELKERTENIAADLGNKPARRGAATRTSAAKNAAGTSYVILHDMVGTHARGSVATFDDLDDAGRQRLLDLKAVRVAKAAEVRSGRAGAEADEE